MTPKRLKYLRLKMRLTQHEFANRLSMERRMIQHYELGRFPIPVTVEYSTYWLMLGDKSRKIFIKKFFKD